MTRTGFQLARTTLLQQGRLTSKVPATLRLLCSALKKNLMECSRVLYIPLDNRLPNATALYDEVAIYRSSTTLHAPV